MVIKAEWLVDDTVHRHRRETHRCSAPPPMKTHARLPSAKDDGTVTINDVAGSFRGGLPGSPLPGVRTLGEPLPECGLDLVTCW